MAETIVVDNSLREIMESVWKTLREVSESQKETDRQMKETDRRLDKLMAETAEQQREVAEQMKETDRRLDARIAETDRRLDKLMAEVSEKQKETVEQMKETDRRMDKRQKELDKRMGYLDNRFGELAEHLVAPGIVKRFNELGYRFDGAWPRGYEVPGEDGNLKAEIDLLENAETLMAVEVKAKPRGKDVKDHIRRLEMLREYRSNRYRDDRKIMGAIAGAIFREGEKNATLKAGMYVIEQSGYTMKIDVPQGFVPREW